MIPKLPAIVAASGLSTRMGASKPLLDAGGRSFLAQILDTLGKGGAGPLFVVVREMDGPEGNEAKTRGGTPILNPDPSPGPISSLQAGIQALPAGTLGTLFCPADHPLFSQDTVRSLIQGFLLERPPLVVPEYEGRRGHPVIFGKELFGELLGGGLPEGARTVTGRYLDRRLVVPVHDQGILADIDTPDDYRRHFP